MSATFQTFSIAILSSFTVTMGTIECNDEAKMMRNDEADDYMMTDSFEYYA